MPRNTETTRKTKSAQRKTQVQGQTKRQISGRKRRKPVNYEDQNLPQPPSPTPPPPKSLINLLRSNKNVFSYFTSLQKNLEYDVKKWKQRARNAEKQLELLKQQNEDEPIFQNKSNKKQYVQHEKDTRDTFFSNGANDKNDDEFSVASSLSDSVFPSKELTSKKETKIAATKSAITKASLDVKIDANDNGIEKNNTERLIDEFFDDDFQSEEDESEEENISPNEKKSMHELVKEALPCNLSDEDMDLMQKTTSETISQNEHLIDENFTVEEKKEFKMMEEAYGCFEKLGVSLVEVIEIENKSDQQTSSNTYNATKDEVANNKNNTSKENLNIDDAESDEKRRVVRPKSDEVIISELSQSFRALIKMKNPILHNPNNEARDTAICSHVDFELFRGSTHIPCYSSQHKNITSYTKDDINQYFDATKDSMNEESNNGDGVHDNYQRRLEHPVATGRKILLQALSILETLDENMIAIMHKRYQEKVTNQENCNDHLLLGNDNSHEKCIYVGLKNRSKLSSKLINELDEEIRSIWALSDRVSRLNQPSSYLIEKDYVSDGSNDDEDEGSVEDSRRNDESEDAAKLNEILSSKHKIRLASLIERSVFASILSSLYLHVRHDPQALLHLTLEYILSTVPSLGAELYPLLPPILSFAVLESLLCSGYIEDCDDEYSERIKWFDIILMTILSSGDQRTNSKFFLGRSLSLTLHVTFRIWEQRRLDSKNGSIRDMAMVEIAAYYRLKKHFSENSSCWFLDLNKTYTDNDFVPEWGRHLVLEILNHTALGSTEQTIENNFLQSSEILHLDSAISIELLLLILGDNNYVHEVSQMAIKKLGSSHQIRSNDFLLQVVLSTILICTRVHCSIRYYECQTETLITAINANQTLEGERNIKINWLPTNKSQFSFHCLCALKEILSSSQSGKIKNDYTCINLKIASSMVQCASYLADGNFTYQASKYFHSNLDDHIIANSSKQPQKNQLMKSSIANVICIGNFPTLRVINLRRRPDRMRRLVLLAQNEQVLLVRGCIALGQNPFPDTHHEEEDDKNNEDVFNKFIDFNLADTKVAWGSFAYDGIGSNLEFEDRVAHMFGNNYKIMSENFVASRWRPNDLRAFDRYARNDDSLVRASPTERACALSHISCWRGAEQTLIGMSAMDTQSIKASNNSGSSLQMFQISGFASGKALLVENENMAPSPVCIILEDDAVLCDRFSSRLATLLEELPRDFHFCSLGYSRPKTAPMLDYSTNLGIPSCLWYLTGYIVSLAGTEYLRKSLPVVGPVDSWIGLKMCSNWDNKYGFMVGVGIHSKSKKENLSRKELVSIIKFRCFAALVPLCHQSMRGRAAVASAKKSQKSMSWRDRDTDIVFSGNL